MMNSYVLIFAIVFVGIQCRSLAPTNPDETGKHRLSRVHRVSDDRSAPIATEVIVDSYVPKNIVDLSSQEKKVPIGFEDLKPFVASQGRKLQKLLNELVEKSTSSKDYGERAAQWLVQTKLILKDLIGDAVTKARRSDAKVKEVTDPITTMTYEKPVSKSVTRLRDLLDSAEEFDIYYQDGRDDERSERKAIVENEGKISRKVGGQMLDDMLADAQEILSRVRIYFDKICRKHLTTLLSNSEIAQHHDLSFGVNQLKNLATA